MADKSASSKSEKKEPAVEHPDTPSGKALAKVGPGGDGEEYAKEKAKHRWGH